MKTLFFQSNIDRGDWWAEELKKRLPDVAVRVWPDIGDARDIDYALVWLPDKGLLATMPNLKVILSLGAGVDHIFRDRALPQNVPICRVVDANLTQRMTEYVLLHVLRYHRQQPAYNALQRSATWEELDQPAAGDRSVGIMGLGELGGDAARHLVALGFRVSSWSRTPKELDGIESFHGDKGLIPFLNRTEILVCLLPLTLETQNILNAELFGELPRDACLINAARGHHLVEEDLIPALDSGRLAGATLDVFRKEPLPADHPFWANPKITVTPHIASISDPRSVADLVAENIRRVDSGQALLNRVDPAVGY